MPERPRLETQPVNAQDEIVNLRRRATILYRTAFLFLILGSTASIGGLAAGQEFKKVKASHVDEAAVATGASLLAGTLLVSRIAISQNTLAEMKENQQKALSQIESQRRSHIN